MHDCVETAFILFTVDFTFNGLQVSSRFFKEPLFFVLYFVGRMLAVAALFVSLCVIAVRSTILAVIPNPCQALTFAPIGRCGRRKTLQPRPIR